MTSRTASWELIPWHEVDWQALEALRDRSVFQTPAWLAFLAETQDGTPVVARLGPSGAPAAYFSGVVVKRYGIKILGSPFAGWTTAYMGFNAETQEGREAAFAALPKLAFGMLGCMHVEIMDRRAAPSQGARAGFYERTHHTFQTDLTCSEDELFAAMSSACRRCIRKAEKSGVTVVECSGAQADEEAFAQQYYEQLREVFAKDGLVPTYGKDRVTALIRHLRGTGDLLLLRALDPDGRCIGTSIYVGRHDLAYFWGNASYRDGQILRPNEALHWYAMRYWKSRGVTIFDWGGGGEYKVKYGVRRVAIPWLRRSRYPVLEFLRSQAQRAFAARQKAAALAAARFGARSASE